MGEKKERTLNAHTLAYKLYMLAMDYYLYFDVQTKRDEIIDKAIKNARTFADDRTGILFEYENYRKSIKEFASLAQIVKTKKTKEAAKTFREVAFGINKSFAALDNVAVEKSKNATSKKEKYKFFGGSTMKHKLKFPSTKKYILRINKSKKI